MIAPRSLAIGLYGVGAMGQLIAAAIRDRADWQLIAWWDDNEVGREAFRTAYPDFAAREHRLADWPAAVTHAVEVAHPKVVPAVLQAAAFRAWTVITASVGGLISPAGESALLAAQGAGVRVLVPSGAIGGLDILRSIPREELLRVTLRTRKPPSALPPDQVAGITEATCLFAGSAREAIAQFPKNINVAVTLSLAGLGADATRVELWADPAATGNTHEIEIDSGIGHYAITCANRSLPANPGTSALAAYSILTLLAGESATMRIGS